MTRVLVLNATYEPINVTSVKRAVILLLKNRAEIIESGVGELHSESMSMSTPVVIRLIVYVRIPRNMHRRITRRAIFARDGHACQYCGAEGTLTIDHVVPRSRGGEHEWENVVASCWPCNKRKGNALPREAGMKLTRTPRLPTVLTFIFIATPSPPTAWEPWLFR
jgi:5-methylcytosine-specific restriction endonuclease McrA